MIGEYVPLSFKSLSKNEENYLNLLNNGIDVLLQYSVNSLKTQEIKELLKINDVDEFKDEFKETDLYSELNKLMRSNVSKVNSPLKTFYNIGSKLGYQSINKRPKDFNQYDEEAFKILSDYVNELVLNLNESVGIGIRNTLYDGVLNEFPISEIGLNLLKVPNLVVDRFTINTHSMMITTTEYSRAINTGTLQSYSNSGVKDVNIVTTGLPNVCDTCIEIEQRNPYTLEEAMRILPVHPHCYMPDTEVFTSNGWKYFYELNKDDKILSLNPETLESEFIDYVRIIQHENSWGYMYHIYNKWFDTCVTPDHDCFILQRKMKNGVRGQFPEFRKPYELNSESCFLRTINNTNSSPEYIEINGLNFKTRDYVFFMAWYLSEGHVLHDKEDAKKRGFPVGITQYKTKTRELLEKELTRICEYLDIKLYVGKKGFELYSKELYDYLLPFGYSHEKYIPNELLKLSSKDLRYFLDNYILGDGHERVHSGKLGNQSIEKVIYTSSIKMVDSLSYLILLTGYYPSISLGSPKGRVVKHYNGEYTQNYDVYTIRVNHSKKALFSACKIDKIQYKGVVYCVELPKYHTLWTRRNGKTSWNGNCACSVVSANTLTSGFTGNPLIVDLT